MTRWSLGTLAALIGLAVALAAAPAGSAKDGDVLVWFPEGWRSGDGRLLRFQAGVGEILLAADVPVVPVHVAGAFEAWPRSRRLPRLHRVTVTFGAPVLRDDLLGGRPGDPGDAQAIADALRRRIADLARAKGADIE